MPKYTCDPNLFPDAIDILSGDNAPGPIDVFDAKGMVIIAWIIYFDSDAGIVISRKWKYPYGPTERHPLTVKMHPAPLTFKPIDHQYDKYYKSLPH